MAISIYCIYHDFTRTHVCARNKDEAIKNFRDINPLSTIEGVYLYYADKGTFDATEEDTR